MPIAVWDILIPTESKVVQRTQVAGQGLLVVYIRDLPSLESADFPQLESIDSPEAHFLSPAKCLKTAAALRGRTGKVRKRKNSRWWLRNS